MRNGVYIPTRPSRRGEPPWELMPMLPAQGDWSVREYTRLLDAGHKLEYSDGVIEVLPMANVLHQVITVWLCALLNDLRVDGRPAGFAVVSGLVLRLDRRNFRLPDVLFCKRENEHRNDTERWVYADLVVEVVSRGGRRRDYERKRIEYAAAGVPEYWIVDPRPRRRQVTLLVLDAKTGEYREAGVFRDGQAVTSPTIAGLMVDVTEMLNRPLRSTP